MKRHRVPRTLSSTNPQRDDSDFVSLHDFADTTELMIYGRIFKITGCNNFTVRFPP